MTTILFPSPIFGPIKSRRLGESLGINLLPLDGKICSFDCIYCECGLNKQTRTRTDLADRDFLKKKLEERILELKQKGKPLDAITFAGNGEPTAHPFFPEILDDVIEIRNRLVPEVKICILTNATNILKLRIFSALLKADLSLLKLDTVSEDYIKRIDRPNAHYDLSRILEVMNSFGGKCAIQTMFMKGEWEGKSVDNTTDEYVLPWLEAIAQIKPQLVTVYTLDRDTPCPTLKKAEPETLRRIANMVRKEGIEVSVSY